MTFCEALNPSPTEHQIYPLKKTVWSQISLLLMKPTDQDSHCFPCILIVINGIMLLNWLQETEKHVP